MGKIIAVVSGKGGTGKTTFTSCIGFALASMGKKVLCLDCDISLRNLDLALGLSDSALMDFSDVLSGRCTLEQAVVSHPKYPSLFLLAAPLAYDGFRVEPEQAAALMGAIRESFDFCLVDAPAGLGQGFRLATQEADHVVVVTTTDVTALRDAQRTVMELERFPNGKVHLVVNRWPRSCCASSTPPSTTPWTPPACPFWAWCRRIRMCPAASTKASPCGTTITMPPGPIITLQGASRGIRSR